MAVGLRRRSLGGTALALAGGWLLYRSLRGRDRRSGPDDGTVMAEQGEVEQAKQRGVEQEEKKGMMAPGATEVERTVTVGESADELYRFWREPDQLTQVVGHFAEVTSAGENRHRWSVAAPLGRRLEWETEIIEDRPGEFLRWRSTETATVPNEGSVSFRSAPADRGTEVTLNLAFDPPGGALGGAAMELLGVVPDVFASKALYRFKSLAETGEIPTLERNPSGRGSGDLV